MTFDEIQQIIHGMLQVQREVQESQIKQSDEIANLTTLIRVQGEELRLSIQEQRDSLSLSNQELREFTQENARLTQRQLNRIVDYSINQEGTSLDLQEDIINLKRRVAALEQKET